MDWLKDIICAFIGSSFGFIFAILLKEIYDRREDTSDKERVRKNIIDELTVIGEDLRKYQNTESAILIETPIWTSVVLTGRVLYLVEKQKRFYDKILDVYNRISAQKKLEDDYQKYKNDINSFRKETINCIDNCIGVINGHWC
jgi:hypothetical protein